ncbi:MAG: DUF4176 domain-containing protein [Clostridium sp.]
MKELPVGSIVMLKSNKRVMVCGVNKKERGTKRIYDYIACDYPQGYLCDGIEILFNKEDVLRVVSVGSKKKNN